MNGHSTGSTGSTPYTHDTTHDNTRDNALTERDDWTPYYEDRELEQIENFARFPSIIDPYLQQNKGFLFELGCGGSHQLAHGALMGWRVGGIDFNPAALKLISDCLARNNHDNRYLVCADVFTHDESAFRETADLLASFGFLEHFREPQTILAKWKTVLHEDGLVISIIPNLYSINAPLMRKFDPEFWAQHVQYTPEEMDRFHREAGLQPVVAAHYTGRYDLDMLTPWDKIRKAINNRVAAKLVRYFAYFIVSKLLVLLPAKGNRFVNSYIMGVYRKISTFSFASSAIYNCCCPQYIFMLS
jgi:SAM-dependent methyltransferase